jgi:hypothetical protein
MDRVPFALLGRSFLLPARFAGRSGDQNRHRLSRAGNRRINRTLHIMAVVQLRNDTEGHSYYRRKLAAGKTPMEAMRTQTPAVRRRLPTDGQRRQEH